MFLQDIRVPAVAKMLEQLGGPLDVSEEKGDRPGRQAGHAPFPPPRIEVRHRPRVRVNVRRITSPLLGCWPSVGPKISLVFTLLLGVLPAFGEARERVGQDRADRRGRRCRGVRPGPRPTIRPRCRMLLLCTPADKIESWVRSAQPSTSGIPEVQRWETIEALVDTGAGYTWIPASTLARLGVSPQSRREFVTADGRIIDGIWL